MLTTDAMTNENLRQIVHLLQLSDSALPVGAFSFSNTLESAIEWGVVGDATSLEEFTRHVVRQSAFSDGVAALNTLRVIGDDYALTIDFDRRLLLSKPSTEQRQMSLRMGRKIAELAATIHPHSWLQRRRSDIAIGVAAGCYPISLAAVAAACDISAEALFASLCYGAASMVVNASLRCLRISHFQTQQILFNSAELIDELYPQARELTIEQLHGFAPQIDILASLHERGRARMFMN